MHHALIRILLHLLPRPMALNYPQILLKTPIVLLLCTAHPDSCQDHER